MAQTFTINTLSSSTDGKSIKIAATATVGTAIHTWTTEVADFHEVWLYANNTSTTAVLLSIEWWDATDPMKVTVPAQSWDMLVVSWKKLKWNATPLTVKAFAATTNVILVGWFIHEIVTT